MSLDPDEIAAAAGLEGKKLSPKKSMKVLQKGFPEKPLHRNGGSAASPLESKTSEELTSVEDLLVSSKAQEFLSKNK